jgi:Helix-turn-helix domain of resolvase
VGPLFAGKAFMLRPLLPIGGTDVRGSASLKGSRRPRRPACIRAVSIDATQVRAMKAQGLGASEIAKALKMGRASVYRVLDAG